jgi:hypothetical protein
MKWYNVRVLIPVYNSSVYALDEQGLQGALSHYVTDGSLRYMSLVDTQVLFLGCRVALWIGRLLGPFWVVTVSEVSVGRMVRSVISGRWEND